MSTGVEKVALQSSDAWEGDMGGPYPPQSLEVILRGPCGVRGKED